MVAILGPQLSRPRELLALWTTAVAATIAVVVPVAYVVVGPAACAAMAGLAPAGRRGVAALAAWFLVSGSVLLGLPTG